jgi:hypothetical protein
MSTYGNTMTRPFSPCRFFPVLSLLMSFLLILLGGRTALAQSIMESDLGGQDPAVLVQRLMGEGVSFSNVTYRGHAGVGDSAGTFNEAFPVIGFDSGIILSTGLAAGVAGASSIVSSTCNDDGIPAPADPDLALLAGSAAASIHDATILSFDFVPDYDTITFRYVFASDEYNKYAGSAFNDVFGFFLNGANVARLPGTSTVVSINNVNNCSNSSYYIDNIGSPQGSVSCPVTHASAGRQTAMNGLTSVLTVNAAVTPGSVHRIKLAIADLGDCLQDSNVFIEANSFVSNFTPTRTETPTFTETPCGWPGLTCTPTMTLSATFTEVPCGWPGKTCTPTPSETPITPIPTATFTRTPVPTATFTFTRSTTPNARPTETFTSTRTHTATPTRTHTPSHTPSATRTPSPTDTPTRTHTPSFTPTATPTHTETPCGWPSETCTFTPTHTPTATLVFRDEFHVSENAFRPSAGPVSLFVAYTRYPGEFSLEVYNSVGEKVYRIAAEPLTAPLFRSYSWDGRNQYGEPCASGIYLLVLTEPFDRKIRKVLLIR